MATHVQVNDHSASMGVTYGDAVGFSHKNYSLKIKNPHDFQWATILYTGLKFLSHLALNWRQISEYEHKTAYLNLPDREDEVLENSNNMLCCNNSYGLKNIFTHLFIGRLGDLFPFGR